MDILGLLDIGMEVVGVVLAVWLGARLGIKSGEAAVGLAERAHGFDRRRTEPETTRVAPPLDWPGDWPLTLTLLARVDAGEGVLHPSVQIRGPAPDHHGRIRLELIDPDGGVRLILKRTFPLGALHTELPLPSFAPPGGASVDEVLRWRWDIVLSGESSERRWRERPCPAGGLNPEAELLRPNLDRRA